MTARRTLRRSAKLLKAFRLEQSDPDCFYDLIARDAAERVGERVRLSGALVLDVGGGAGYLAKAFRAAGSTCVVVEPDLTELSWRGARPDGAVIGDGYRLPFRSGRADLVLSSNVLEHVQRPYRMLDELARVTRPGGFVWVSFTNWYSPWGGHEISPWHYLGAERALARYRRRYGRSPKNLLGTNLFKVHVGETLRHVGSSPLFEVVDAGPRYHPAFARGVVRVPGLREVVTWNLELLLRRSRVPAEVRAVNP
ncbi:MAG: class I SAM-dependent methyltransferase [Actinomycetota bacterium]|nr:class I SAM-dependent methyltransferase [Actinomycetota bacterium]